MPIGRGRLIRILWKVAIVSAPIAHGAPSQPQTPTLAEDFSSEFVLRQTEGGTPGEKLHFVNFECHGLQCVWRSVTLNDCSSGASWVAQETFATQESSFFRKMDVIRRPRQISVTLDFGEELTKAIFVMEMECNRKSVRMPTYCMGYIKTLSSSVSKFSTSLGKPISFGFELVPRELSPSKLGCPLITRQPYDF